MIVITGASSGLGAQLAKLYDAQGEETLLTGRQPKAQESTYCAVKWAVKGLIESVRMELKGKPMKIIAVYPGGMATEFWETSGKSLDTSSFMSAGDAATMIHGALSNIGNGYVSDITVNRL
ncbi:SDR family NAD(P)-dependent oxidoreductase [Vibrio owensii]|uniref:SDR family NAD(P)-dependent oxidoreductase n=1 Tax=Vibrio owensii TaxID=696485 RepID=UPI002F40D296